MALCSADLRRFALCGSLPLALVAGCAAGGPHSVGGSDAGASADGGARADARPPDNPTAVYAQSATTLYEVDPDTLDITEVGDFTFDKDAQNITDIAIDANGTTIAISLAALYSVDKSTAAATYLTDLDATLDIDLTSLSFVPVDPNDPQSDERLIAADFDGVVYEIDPNTGDTTVVGDYGSDDQGHKIGSSGDIVSVRGLGTLATVTVEGEQNDYLAWINPTTFEASLLGDTGFDRIFGIGFWEDTVYGFTDDKEFVTLDSTTGEGSEVGSDNIRWWGAGVTTKAPVVN